MSRGENSKNDPRPFGQRNWLESRFRDTPEELYEVALHSDAKVVGELLSGFGPYQVLNLIAEEALFGSSRPVAALRVENYLENATPSMDVTDSSSYHGASFWEELTSLLSLSLGIRLRAGGVIRDFREDEEKGHPYAELLGDHPFLLTTKKRQLLPRLNEGRNWADAGPIVKDYPDLSPAFAVRLVRAARSYQNAVWIADTDPSLAWLLMVSAIEAAAYFLDGGPSKRFVSFIETYAPPPPPHRPPKWARLDWTRLGARCRQVYKFRSEALHEAKPFPWPVCETPLRQPDWEGPAETFFAISASGQGASWLAKDLPMFLNTFEYLVRGALLNWWKEAAEAQRGASKG